MITYFLLIIVLFPYTQNGNLQSNTLNIGSKLQTILPIESLKPIELVDSISYSDLNIILNRNNAFEYSSIDSTCWKMYLVGNKTVKFGLTNEDKKLIYETVQRIDYFNIPNRIIQQRDTCISPSFSTEITICIKDRCHKVYYAGECNIKDNQIKLRFEEIESLLFNIIMKKKEIKSLPEPDIDYF